MILPTVMKVMKPYETLLKRYESVMKVEILIFAFCMSLSVSGLRLMKVIKVTLYIYLISIEIYAKLSY